MHKSSAVDPIKEFIYFAVMDNAMPLITSEQFIIIGERTVRVFNLDPIKTTFSEICEYMLKFLKTPFGKKLLNELIEVKLLLL